MNNMRIKKKGVKLFYNSGILKKHSLFAVYFISLYFHFNILYLIMNY